MIIQLKNILPNPYRNFTINPLDEKRIERLVESINATGFWNNVAVRQREDGKYEAVYGHHRLKAAMKAGIKEADITVQNLTDTQMLERLSRDNDPAYDSTFLAVIETVFGAVQGLAEGTQEPFEIIKDTRKDYIMYAPSFVPGAPVPDSGTRPYTALVLAQRLGYTKKGGNEANAALETALDILMLAELGEIEDFSRFKDVSANKAAEIIQDKLVKLEKAKERKHAEAVKAKADAERAKFEADRKKQKNAEEALALASLKKKQELEKQEREATRQKEVDKAAKLAEQLRKTDEVDKLRTLKLRTDVAEKALTKYGAPSVKQGAAIEKNIKLAKEALKEKDPAKAEKISAELGKVSQQITDAYLEQKKQEEAKAEQDRKSQVTRSAVATLLLKLQRIGSEADPLFDNFKTLSRNPAITMKERDLLFKATRDASERLYTQANMFLPPTNEDVLKVEAQKALKEAPEFEAEHTASIKEKQTYLDEQAEKRRLEREKENEELQTKKEKSMKPKSKKATR